VVGLANSSIQTFDVRTGVRTKSLKGHSAGVWALCLVESGGYWAGGPEGNRAENQETPRVAPIVDETTPPSSPDRSMEMEDLSGGPSTEPQTRPPRRSSSSKSSALNLLELGVLDDPQPCPAKASDATFRSEGWGQSHTLVVSGGCDKDVRVWELPSGRCIYKLRGHTSTIRCLRVLHNRPIAISGSRDGTLRVWDIRRGKQMRVLQGHMDSVRALDVFGNRAVSGSYDRTCRVSPFIFATFRTTH
jgi:F-box and WD-40 domain protein CDC4